MKRISLAFRFLYSVFFVAVTQTMNMLVVPELLLHISIDLSPHLFPAHSQFSLESHSLNHARGNGKGTGSRTLSFPSLFSFDHFYPCWYSHWCAIASLSWWLITDRERLLIAFLILFEYFWSSTCCRLWWMSDREWFHMDVMHRGMPFQKKGYFLWYTGRKPDNQKRSILATNMYLVKLNWSVFFIFDHKLCIFSFAARSII